MKNLLTALILFSSVTLIANELKWVDEQIEAIKPPRKGISSSKINMVEDPFIFLLKNKEKTKKSTLTSSSKLKSTSKYSSKKSSSKSSKLIKKSKVLTLNAIINKSALINGKWYKIKDKIGKYTIININKTDIILSYKKKRLFLTTNSKNKNLKFKNN